jgi:hypothetical protein
MTFTLLLTLLLTLLRTLTIRNTQEVFVYEEVHRCAEETGDSSLYPAEGMRLNKVRYIGIHRS